MKKKDIVIPVATGASVGIVLCFYKLYRQRLVEKKHLEVKNIDVDNYMAISPKDLREEESTLEDTKNTKRKYISLRG